MVEHAKRRITPDEDEISLLDIVHFFRFNGKFILLTTVGLSAIAFVFALFQSKQYQKQLTLSVKPLPVPVSQLPGLDANQASNLAVEVLQSQPLDQITVQPKYDTATQQINLTLQSPNPNALATATPEIQNQLEKDFQEELSTTVEVSLNFLEFELNKAQKVLTQLEQQIAQFPSNSNTERLEALETQRAQQAATIPALEFDKQYLEQVRDNLVEFTPQAFSIKILTESAVHQTHSLVKIAILAIIASFMVAILAAIIREQILRLKAELSKNKIDPSQDV